MKPEYRQTESEIGEKANGINRILQTYLPEEKGFQKTVLEAMNYSIQAGGKRLRPMLIAECFRLFGGSGRITEPFMAAMEMIHTYSLVHDDLPAMDNDLYRRGKKTTHAVYGEAMGILAGDALLNYAYETAWKAFEMDEARDPMVRERVIRALGVLARKAGVYGMVGGQVADVESEKKGLEISREKLEFIHYNKTAALIEASMMIGSILAGADPDEVNRIEKIAQKIGLAFQIQDDILDVTGTQEELGKPIGSDEKNQKVTYVTFEGVEKSAADVERLSGQAIEELKGFGREAGFLEGLFLWLIHRRK